MNYCIIFDLDGTLVDSIDDLTSAVNYMRSEYGLAELSRNVVQSYVGNGVKELIRRSIQDSICDFDGALEKMSSYYREHIVDKTVCYFAYINNLFNCKYIKMNNILLKNTLKTHKKRSFEQ